MKNSTKISKSLLNTILDIHENAEMYDKKEVLLLLLDEEENNYYIKEELEEMGYCICGNEFSIERENQSSEHFGAEVVEEINHKKCPSCGSTSNS